MKKISALFVFFLFISCSQNKPVIEVIYTINEFSTEDNRINVTLDITNKTNNDISSLWSLHWNQISAKLDKGSLPNNLKYEYVGGQSYNILSFDKDFTNTHLIGNVMYTEYIHLFQISGIILLLAMIGAIVLTFRKREGIKTQSYFKQVSRERDDSVELIDVEFDKGVKLDD